MNKLWNKAKKTKQKKVTWYVISELAPTWVGEDEESLVRPYITLVADLDKDMIRHVNITEAQPTEDEVLESVLQAITKPGGGVGLGVGLGMGGKFRPATIQVNDTAVLDKLQPLHDIGIQCEQVAKPPLIVNMLRQLEQHLTGREYRPGLLAIPKVTHPLLQELYTAAAEYYERGPFDTISDSEPVAIRFPPDASPKYGVIMGYGGEEYGLTIYNSTDELSLIYSGQQPHEITDDSIFWLAILFDFPHYLPFEELDAIAEYDWSIAAEDAYPFITRLRPASGGFELPTESEIRLLAAALRTIPQFVDDHVDEEGYPIMGIDDVVYELPAMYGHQSIALNWAEIEGMENGGQIDFDDMGAENIAAMGVAAAAEFIDGWNFDEKNEEEYYEAIELGAFILTYVQVVQIQEPDRTMDDLEYLADVCWELGAMVIEHAPRPWKAHIFTGPPRFVDEYADEMAEDEDDVVRYQIIWDHMGHFARIIESAASDEQTDGEFNI